MNNKKVLVHKKPDKPTLEDLMLALRRKIIESMRSDDMSRELTMSQFEALRTIGVEDAKTMKDIAEALHITPPSATALIEEMEHKKLVLRERHPTDRRIVFIRLSKKAHALFSRVCARKEAIMNRMLRKLSATDKKSLERIIGIIISK